MHSDPKLTERLRPVAEDQGLDERVMFGGVAFFLGGNFCCGIWHDRLILRLGEEGAIEALFKKDVHPMDITGKPMRGWVMVGPDGCKTKRQLDTWVAQAATFVAGLPAKTKRATKRKTKRTKTTLKKKK
ncbi:MAG: TfoX/Sxy family protein [Phycisphaerales bacterium]